MFSLCLVNNFIDVKLAAILDPGGLSYVAAAKSLSSKDVFFYLLSTISVAHFVSNRDTTLPSKNVKLTVYFKFLGQTLPLLSCKSFVFFFCSFFKKERDDSWTV